MVWKNFTLETSGEDVKTTLETSGEDVKTTLETSGEDSGRKLSSNIAINGANILYRASKKPSDIEAAYLEEYSRFVIF